MSGADPAAARPPTAPVLPDLERRRLVETRIEALRRLLHEHGADGALLTRRRDFSWLTVGGTNHVVLASSDGVAPLLVTRGETIVVAPVNEAPRLADEELRGLPLSVEETPWWAPDAAQEVARRRLGAERLLDEAALEDPLRTLRQRLEPVEHRRLEWLGRLARVAVDRALGSASAGTTEDELAARALEFVTRAGARCPVLLVAADERIELYRHPLPTGRAIKQRAMLVVVPERWGLHVALTGVRELAPPDEQTERRNAAVREVLLAMRGASRPGSSLGGVLAAAQSRYAELGFADEWRLHHQGGTIGYAGRETIATPAEGTLIEAGMALAWNPSVAGAKAEETLYLDSAGEPQVVTGKA